MGDLIEVCSGVTDAQSKRPKLSTERLESLCEVARKVLLEDPVLLELEAPIHIVGSRRQRLGI